DGSGAVIFRITDISQHTIKRIGMKIAPPHLDDRAEAAIEGAPARGLDYINLSPQHGVAIEYSSAAVGQLDLVTIQAVDCTSAVVMPAISLAVRQSNDPIACAAVLNRAQQLSKCDFPLAADDKIHARIRCRICLRRKAGIISADHHMDTGFNRTY